MKNLDWNEILKHLQNFATSGSAKYQILNLSPLPSSDEAKKSFAQIIECSEILIAGHRPFMESLDLFEPWFSRIKKKALLKNLEIKDVRHFCLETLALKETLSPLTSSWAKLLRSELMNAEEPLSAIDRLLTPRGEIRVDASPVLYRLFKEKEGLTRQVESTLDHLVKDHQMTSMLQDKYVTTREGRWVLPIKGGMQHFVPGVIHASSQSKQTVFMEPEAIIPMNNRLRQIEVEIEDEIERLLIELSNYLATQANEFEKTKSLLLETDILLAKAQFSIRIGATACRFSHDEIHLLDVKHPLLLLAGKDVIANTVRLTTDKRILLLSGPNAGGKTILLKSLGLASQMARCGLLICAAESSVVPFFEKIHIGIGDAQNVGEDLSTFAGHLKILDEASKLQGSNNLILIDEVCGSTDPEEGSVLARSFIEAYIKNNCFAVLTSHLSPLKTGWKPQDPLLNGSLEYDVQSGKPTYQFLSGIAGDSFAIQTAKRVGVSDSIIERATALLSPAAQTKLAAMDEIDQIKSDLHLLRESLKKDSQRTKNEKEKYESLIKNFEIEKEKNLNKIIRENEKKIEDLLAQAKVEQTFKRHTNLQEIKNQLPEIIKSRSSTPSLNTAEDFAAKYPAGSKVFVPSLGQDGIIQSLPNSKGEILVLSGSIRLSLPWQELKTAQKVQNSTAQLVRRNYAVAVALDNSEKTLDLRGKTVDEALSDLEIQLDISAASQQDRIKIIHGHGTEALKKAVRTYLSRSVYVKKWKSGSNEQGGDGVTWAELNRD